MESRGLPFVSLCMCIASVLNFILISEGADILVRKQYDNRHMIYSMMTSATSNHSTNIPLLVFRIHIPNIILPSKPEHLIICHPLKCWVPVFTEMRGHLSPWQGGKNSATQIKRVENFKWHTIQCYHTTTKINQVYATAQFLPWEKNSRVTITRLIPL